MEEADRDMRFLIMWNAKERQWKRLLDKPLTDGRGQMNAYMQGPLLGPDGMYHLLPGMAQYT